MKKWIRGSVLTALLALVELWLGRPDSVLLRISLGLLVLVTVGFIASVAIYPKGLSYLERGGLTVILLFLIGGTSGIALGLMPVGLSLSSIGIMLLVEMHISWLLAEWRLRQDRQKSKAKENASYQRREKSFYIQVGVAVLTMLSTVMAIFYVIDGTEAPLPGFSELYIESIDSTRLRVAIANHEGRTVSYKLCVTGDTVKYSTAIIIQNGEIQVISLPRLRNEAMILLFKDREPKVYRSLVLNG